MTLSTALFNHAETLMRELLATKFPADGIVSRYFREHRALGQADRAFVAEAVYAVLRRKRSLSARCGDDITARRLLLAALVCTQGRNLRELDGLLNRSEGAWLGQAKAIRLDALPRPVQADWPDWLYERLSSQLAEDDLMRLAEAMNQPAPLDLRVNTLKAERADVLVRLQQDGIAARACSYSPVGVRLAGKPALAKHPLFLDGSIEVQDEGSQLLGYLLAPRRGEMVVDFCAGAGGKTLLLGAMMRSQGRLYAFDVAEKRLAKIKPRLARSGLSNVHPVRIDSEHDIKIKRLAGKIDRVLVDAPCSGLGTLRRNPDLKWRQTPSAIDELIAKQTSILSAASALVKSGGRLVYATCSLLNEENEAVVQAFQRARPEFKQLPAGEVLQKQGIDVDGLPADDACLRVWPHRHGTDGFFAAVLERQ